MENPELHLTPTPSPQRYKSFIQILLVVSTVALGGFYFGYALAYMNAVDFDVVISTYKITWDSTTAEGLLNGCIPIGAGIGALITEILIKKFSRRQFLFIVNFVAFAAGAFLYVQNEYVLLIVRLFQGICVGFYSMIVPVVIK